MIHCENAITNTYRGYLTFLDNPIEQPLGLLVGPKNEPHHDFAELCFSNSRPRYYCTCLLNYQFHRFFALHLKPLTDVSLSLIFKRTSHLNRSVSGSLFGDKLPLSGPAPVVL